MLVGIYDLRGVFLKELTWDIIYSSVSKFYKFFKRKPKKFLLASDFNKNNLLIKEFIKNLGIPFEDLGILPTPIFYYQVIKNKLPGIMVTASHLPLKYSGLKFILANGTSWKPKLSHTNSRNFSDVDLSGLNKQINNDYYNDYFEKLRLIIKPKKKIFVNFDLKNYFLRTSLPYFKKLKIFHKAKAKIKIKSDFDNDRIFISYKDKKILNDLIFYYLALRKNYKNLGVPIFFSKFLEKKLKEKKKKVFYIKTGHYYFKKVFKKLKLDLAFEPSGHFYFFKDLKTEAPYLALGLFLQQRDFKELEKVNLYRFSLELPKNWEKLIISLKKDFDLKLKKFDGYFLQAKEFYLHLRKSETENKLRVSYEGPKNLLRKIKKWFRKR